MNSILEEKIAVVGKRIDIPVFKEVVHLVCAGSKLFDAKDASVGLEYLLSSSFAQMKDICKIVG